MEGTKRVKKVKATKKELPKCPWCKTLPTIVHFRGTNGLVYYVGCENQKCEVNPRTAMTNKEPEARKWWSKCGD